METETRKGSLNRRINLIELLLMLLMALITVGISYYAMRSTYLRFYNEKGEDIVRMTAAQIDGDRLAQCLKSEHVTEEDYYQEVLATLNTVKSNVMDRTFIYMFVPGENSFTYIMEAFTPNDDPDLLSSYGETFEYGETERLYMLPDALAKKPSTGLVLAPDVGYGRALSNWAPVVDSAGELVVMLELDYNTDTITRELRGYMLKIIAAFLACIAAVLIITLFTIRRIVTAPLEKLTGYVDSYEHGALNAGTMDSFRSRDEIQSLATSFREMTLRIESYIRDLTTMTAERERLGAELSVATQIQADILPRGYPPFPDRHEFDIFALMTPAKEVGGDFYDYFLVDQNHLAMVIGDVSGKSVPASLFMVISKTLIKNRAQMRYNPAEVLRSVSDQLCEGNETELIVTVWLAVIDLTTGRGIAANAGHQHPVLRRKDGTYELVIYRHDPPMAAMPGIRYSEHEFQLYPGDSIFVCSDGVIEALNTSEEMYGRDRMLGALNRNAARQPEELLGAVLKDIESFVGRAPKTDDITMMSIRYWGEEGRF